MKTSWKTLSVGIISALLALMLILSSSGLVYAQGNESIVNASFTYFFDNLLNGIRESIDKFLASIQSAFVYLIRRGIEFLITIARASYIALGLLGITLWATGISPYRGRHLIIGSIVLAIVSEVAYGLLG